MKSNIVRALCLMMSLALVVTAFTACKKGSGAENTTVGANEWSQGVPDTKVDLTAEEIIDLVNAALGDKAPAKFDGDLTKLSADDIALVKAKAEELGYYFEKNDDGTFTVQKTVSLVNVSDGSVVALVNDALGEEAATEFNGDLGSLSDEDLEKVKEFAEKEDVYIVEDEKGEPVAKIDSAKSSDSENTYRRGWSNIH